MSLHELQGEDVGPPDSFPETKANTMDTSKPSVPETGSPNSAVRFSTGQTVSIIGAGVMGRGIAAAAVRAGIPVRISDSNTMAAIDAVEQILESRESRDGLRPRLVDPTAGPLISVATDDAEIADADLIIETVSENFESSLQSCRGSIRI